MPWIITWTGTNKKIEFAYTATGQKLRKVVTSAGGTATVTTAGIASPVSVPVALGGTALAGHGALTVSTASNNLFGGNKKDSGVVQNGDSSKSNVSSGNKNSPHANQKAKESAQSKYENLREQYNTQKSQPNKTPDDKKALETTRKQMDATKKKADFNGENHSRNAKGN